MRQFGPLRNLWEGKNHGEQFLRCVKCEVASKFVRDWEVGPVKKVYQKQALDVIIESESVSSSTATSEVELDGCFLYKSVTEIMKSFMERLPLSMVMLENGIFGCITKEHKIVEFSCDAHVCSRNGCDYHIWSLKEIPENGARDLAEFDETAHFLLLLPRLVECGLPPCTSDAVYTTINSEWMEMKKDGSFGQADFD